MESGAVMRGDLIGLGLDFSSGFLNSTRCTDEGKRADAANGVAPSVVGGVIGAAVGAGLFRNLPAIGGGFVFGLAAGQVVGMVWGNDLPQIELSPKSQFDEEICKLRNDRWDRLTPVISNLAAATQKECGFSPIDEDRLKNQTEQEGNAILNRVQECAVRHPSVSPEFKKVMAKIRDLNAVTCNGVNDQQEFYRRKVGQANNGLASLRIDSICVHGMDEEKSAEANADSIFGSTTIPAQSTGIEAHHSEVERWFESGYGLLLNGINVGSQSKRNSALNDAIRQFDGGLMVLDKLPFPDRSNTLSGKFYLHRGVAKHLLRQALLAEEDFQRATTADPRQFRAYYNLAELYLEQSGNRQIDLVIGNLGKALELERKDNGDQDISCDSLKIDFREIWNDHRLQEMLAEKHVSCS